MSNALHTPPVRLPITSLTDPLAFRAWFAAGPAMVTAVSPGGAVVCASESAARALGRCARDLECTPLAELYHPQDRFAVRAALDEALRAPGTDVRRELRRIHDATGVTTVFVTHDQEEALELADRVAVLDGGALQQVGSPADVLDRPATAFVAGFVGDANRLKGVVTGGVFTAGPLRFGAGETLDGVATAFLRPEDVALGGDAGAAAVVTRVVPRGPGLLVDAALEGDGRTLECALARGEAPPPSVGETVRLTVRRAQVFAD